MLPYNHIDENDEFILALSDNFTTAPPIPFDLLLENDKLFVPFELNDDLSSPIFDHDPDIQYYNTVSNINMASCNYHLEDSLNKKIEQLNIGSNCLSMIHSNIRSIPKNLNKFELYLRNLNIKFPIIGFSETWIQDHSTDRYSIKGYRGEHNYRKSRSGGGVALYIQDNWEYTVRKDLCQMKPNIESLFIEVDKNYTGKDKNIIIGVIYRPPDTDIKTFNYEMSEILSNIKIENKLTYLLGDFNVNLLNIDKHKDSQDFVDYMYSHSMFPCINKPTRVTAKTATLIDNIFTSDIGNDHALSGILYSDITDHFPVFYIDYGCETSCQHRPIMRRNFSQQNCEHFSATLQNYDWISIMNATDPQEAYTLFHNEFSNIYNASFPIRKIKPGYKNRKPWLTEGLKKSIKTKNKLYLKQLKSKDPEHVTHYKDYKRSLDRLLAKTEREHYENILQKNQSNMRKSWQILKEVINKKKNVSTCSRFMVNNTISTNRKIIADSFNSFFVDIGPSLAKKIPNDGRRPEQFLSDKIADSMCLSTVLEDEVRQIIHNLKESSAGWDSISSKIVKTTYMHFLTPLTHVLNLSLVSGVVPSELKIAKVIPLFKSGDASVFSNYRPVSVLPVFSKILERLMYSRLLSFININKILYKFQFGFREDHSPQLALIYLVDKISNALENGEYVLGVFLDFSKAFNTVDHDILFTKLHHYGVRGVCLNWFKSYLSNREQFVCFSGTDSDKKGIRCGVPQGSILGPLLFLIYINDLSSVSQKLFSLLFADDSNMFITGKNPDTLIELMNTELVKVVDL